MLRKQLSDWCIVIIYVNDDICSDGSGHCVRATKRMMMSHDERHEQNTRIHNMVHSPE